MGGKPLLKRRPVPARHDYNVLELGGGEAGHAFRQ